MKHNPQFERQGRLDPPRRALRENFKAMQERFHGAATTFDELARYYFDALVAADAERGFPPRPWVARHPTLFERTWREGPWAILVHERFTDGYTRWLWRAYRTPESDAEENKIAFGREYTAIDAIREATRTVQACLKALKKAS